MVAFLFFFCLIVNIDLTLTAHYVVLLLVLNELYRTNDISRAQVNIAQSSAGLISLILWWSRSQCAVRRLSVCARLNRSVPLEIFICFSVSLVLSPSRSSIIHFHWQSITSWFAPSVFCISVRRLLILFACVVYPFHQRLSDNCLSFICGHFFSSSSRRFASLFWSLCYFKQTTTVFLP